MARTLGCLIMSLGTFAIGCADQHPPAIERPELAVVAIAPSADAAPVAQGFFVSPDGSLVTCAHAVGAAHTMAVIRPGMATLTATLVQADAEHDVALLKVDAAEMFPWLPLHDGDVIANQHVRAVTTSDTIHGTFDHWESF